MTPRIASLLACSLMLLCACAATGLPAPEAWNGSVVPHAEPAAMHSIAAATAVPRGPAEDSWSLFAAPPSTPAIALAPQGPGPRFKPQPSLGSTQLMLNGQQLTRDYWRPSSRHGSFGLQTSFERRSDWVGGEGGFFVVKDNDEGVYVVPGQGNTTVKTDLTMLEVFGGVRRTFLRESRLRPYVGAGASFFWVDADQTIKPRFGDKQSDSGHDYVFGVYGHAGVSYQLGHNLQFGVEYRVVGLTNTDVLIGSSGDVDYHQVSIFLGYGG